MMTTVRQKLALAVLILFGGTGFQAFAENYWVVGSLASESMAIKESDRLIGLTGANIKISNSSKAGKMYHRLVILATEFDAAHEQQFERLQIKPWLITLGAETGVSDVADGQYFFIAGSYSDVTEALAAERKLGGLFVNVRGETVLIDGSVYHRVLIGPLTGGDVPLTRSTLISSGFTQSSLIDAGQVAEYQTAQLRDEPYREDTAVVNQPISKPIESVPANSNPTGFNLARLREKPPEMPRP